MAIALLLGGQPAQAATCFAAAKTYQIHPLHGGPDMKDGWKVSGDGFDQCVHREEAAEKLLRTRYPDTAYNLSPAATVGCHAPCTD